MEKVKSTTEKKHYSQLVEEAVDFSLQDQHLCNLRTCFDPYSFEWTQTKMDTKIDILKKVLANGNDLNEILTEYKITYNDNPASKDTEQGLANLLQYLLIQGNREK